MGQLTKAGFEVIEEFANWKVEPGQYVDLGERGGVFGARLVQLEDGNVLLCGWWLIRPDFLPSLGLTMAEYEKIRREWGENEEGTVLYPACAYLEPISKNEYDISLWGYEGEEAAQLIR